MVTLFFAFCFHGGVLGLEKHIQTRNMKKKNLCTKQMVEASTSALGHRKWGGPVQTQFFKIKIKRPN